MLLKMAAAAVDRCWLSGKCDVCRCLSASL